MRRGSGGRRRRTRAAAARSAARASSGRGRASSGRAEREKKRTISRIVPKHEGALEPEVGADVVACRSRARSRSRRAARCAAPPSPRSSRTIAVRSPERPGMALRASRRCASRRRRSRSAGSGRRVYETKYARVSHQKRSTIPCAREQPLPAQRHRQRGPDHDRDREHEPPRVGVEQRLDVSWMSIFQTR